jgi:hypothetical protein
MNKINNVISHKNKKNDCISIYSCNNIASKKDTNYADVLYYLINEVMQLLPLGIKEVLYISKHEKDIANTKVNSIENLNIKQGYYEILAIFLYKDVLCNISYSERLSLSTIF